MVLTTHQQLIDEGIYKEITIALHTPPHRTISLALVAQALGATKDSARQHQQVIVRVGIDQQRRGRRRRLSMSLNHEWVWQLLYENTVPIYHPRAPKRQTRAVV